jgi:hypothetical protein
MGASTVESKLINAQEVKKRKQTKRKKKTGNKKYLSQEHYNYEREFYILLSILDTRV